MPFALSTHRPFKQTTDAQVQPTAKREKNDCRRRTIYLITIFLIHLWLMILLHSVVNASNVVLRAARISREIIEKES